MNGCIYNSDIHIRINCGQVQTVVKINMSMAVTWKDKVRNETTRDTTGQDMLEATVQKRRLRWFGHV